jgi:hypothetical protein
MIKMPMGVHDVVDALSAQTSNGGFNFVRQLRYLVVDNEHAVGTKRYRDIATHPKSNVKTIGYFFARHLGCFWVPCKNLQQRFPTQGCIVLVCKDESRRTTPHGQ